MRSIRVDPEFAKLTGYSSAAEAIWAASQNPRAKRSEVESKAVVGARLRDFFVSDKCVRLLLANDSCIEMIPSNRVVEWQIVQPEHDQIPTPLSKPEAMELVWPGLGPREWDPVALLKRRQNLPIHGLFGGEAFLNVEFKAGGILQFVPLWNCSEQSSFLYFFDLEE